MKKFLALCAASLILLSSFALAQDAQGQKGKPEPPYLGVHWARGVRPSQNAPTSPDMTWHSGAIMPTAVTASIFWGTSWTTTNYKVTGMDSWYNGVGGSTYAATCDEYTGTNGQVTSTISYGGHFVDTTAAPSRAWHSYGTCGGTPVQFAFFFNLDNDPGCDPQDTATGHPQGLSALANVSGHELSEARTDPRGAGWFDSSGAENGDKCAWTFGSRDLTFNNGSVWKIQGNWSNRAFNSSTGYPNSSGQDGCIDGGNFK
jgi:hypothetical protein